MKHFNKYWVAYFALIVVSVTLAIYFAVQSSPSSLYMLNR